MAGLELEITFKRNILILNKKVLFIRTIQLKINWEDISEKNKIFNINTTLKLSFKK